MFPNINVLEQSYLVSSQVYDLFCLPEREFYCNYFDHELASTQKSSVILRKCLKMAESVVK